MDKYDIKARLGEGSFGQVYKAERKFDNTKVALKLINKHGRSDNELTSLRKEYEIQKNFNHPNIIQMLDSFETEHHIAIVTELAYRDLYQTLATEGILTEKKAVKITGDLISALYYLHSNRVLHRDLKPQNVLLNENGTAKLCDFGFARNLSQSTHVLTSIKGTPLYMAPELIETNIYDHNADLWSLGCITYEMLVGSPPFKTNNLLHLVKLIRDEDIKWPEVIVSAECLSLLKGLLHKNPSERLSWPHLLDHPFVKGNVLILSEKDVPLPLTAELTASQAFAKELQRQYFKSVQTQWKLPAIPGQRLPFRGEIYFYKAEISRVPSKNRIETGCEKGRQQTQQRKEDKSNKKSCGQIDMDELIGKLKDVEMAGSRSYTAKFRSHGAEMVPVSKEDLEEIEKLEVGWREFQLNALQADEWTVFLQRNIEEVMAGDVESCGVPPFLHMVCRALSSPSPSVLEYTASLLSIPFTIQTIPESQLDKIREVYADVKLVSKLVYASKFLVSRPDPENNLNAEQLEALNTIFLLITNLVYSKRVFFDEFCKVSHLLRLSDHYAFLLSLRGRKLRIAINLLAILTLVIRLAPQYKHIVENVVRSLDNPESEIRSMLNHPNELLVVRTLYFLRQLAVECCDLLKTFWSDSLHKDLNTLAYNSHHQISALAEETLNEIGERRV